MDWGKIKESLVLVALTGVFGIVTGWLFGTSQSAQMANDIAVIKSGIQEIKDGNKTRDGFDRCSELRLDRLEHGIAQPSDCGGIGGE